MIWLIAIYGVRATAMDSRLKTAGLLGQELADYVASTEGQLVIPQNMDERLKSRLDYFNFQGDLCLFIADQEGRLLFSVPETTQEIIDRRMNEDYTDVEEPQTKAVITPVQHNGVRLGQVTFLLSKQSLASNPHEITIALVALFTLIMAGWLTIYLLSRKLSRPIRQVAEGAHLIREGHYDINLEVATSEREIQELVDAFGDMAQRLKQLEDWRALSLAGVTHELKTPVTSIKGLLLAVREGVVTEEESGEFLDIALQESGRLERMVADLLDYNAMSAGNVQISSVELDLNGLISEIVYQWGLTNRLPDAEVKLALSEQKVHCIGDPLRIQQIVLNLLNNARQAQSETSPAKIEVRIVVASGKAMIEVQDDGTGISPQEVPYIFDRFFRGAQKKLRTRGLGLGLTYSQLLARAQGGELELVQTSAQGSIFRLRLPLAPE